jgi:NitT/TauT family transport system permease protein
MIDDAKAFSLRLLPFVSLLAIWQLLSSSSGPRFYFLPPPAQVVIALANLTVTQSFYKDVSESCVRVIVAFIASLAISIPLGVLSGRYLVVSALITPVNDFLRYLPVGALVPICILAIGIGDGSKIALIFLGTVFQLIPLIADASRQLPEELLDVARIQGGSRWNVLSNVVWPWCLPFIYDHSRVAFGWAWSYLVVAELVASEFGIGHFIMEQQRFLKSPQVLAGIVVIGLLGLGSDLAFRKARKYFVPWQHDQDMNA